MGDGSPAEILRTKTVKLLRSVLVTKAKVGIPLHSLPFEYEETASDKLKFREMGYGSLEQFLRDIPDVCTVSKAREGYLVVKGIPSESDAHVYKLAVGQKASKKKKKPAFAKSFNISQVRRRASHFTGGHKPNTGPSMRNTYTNSPRGQPYGYGNTPTAKLFGSTSFNQKPYFTLRQTPSYNQRQVSSMMPAQSIPPRFLRQQVNRPKTQRSYFNNTNDVIVISDDEKPANLKKPKGFIGNARLPDGEMIMLGPSTSTPNPTAPNLSPSELSSIEAKFRNMMLQRGCGVWYARMKEEYKTINKVDAPLQLEAIVEKHFRHFVEIEDPTGTGRKIMYMKKNVEPAKEISSPQVSSTSHLQKTMTPIPSSNSSKKFEDLQVTSSFSPNQQAGQRSVEKLTSPLSISTKRASLSPPRTEQFTIELMELPNQGDLVKVYVCHVETLNRFFVQLSNSPIDDLVAKMQEYYESNAADGEIVKPRCGEFCCARYSKDRLWFRAKVLSVKQQKNSVNESYRCRVIYIDYGNDEYVVSSELKSLTQEFSELPVQGIQCTLHDLFPMEENVTWTEKDIEYFKKVTDDVQLTLSVKQKNGTVLSVDLLDEQGQSICKHLQIKGMARRSLNSSSSPVSLSPSSSSSDLSDTKRPTLSRSLSVEPSEIKMQWVEISKDEDYVDALVSNINSTNDLYIIIIGPENLDKLQKLESELTKHYNKDSVPVATELEVGKFYVAFSDDIWHRAKLLSCVDNDYEMLLLDRGKKTIVSANEIKDLPLKYCKLPFQAIPCSLSKVPESFDAEILQYLSEATLGEARIACIIERPSEVGQKYHIELYDTTSDLDVNLNCEIITKLEAEKDLSPKLPEIGGGQCQAYIAHITLTGEFFIQILGAGLEKLELLMEDMTSHFSQNTRASEIVSRPEVGTICCAKFHDDGAWYRAKVTKVMYEERQVEVEFIDYGNREIIRNMLIRKPNAVSRKVLDLPFQAVKCKVQGIAKFTDEQHTKIIEFVTNHIDLVLVEVVRKDGDLPVVNITIPPENENDTPPNFVEKFKQYQDFENQNIGNANNYTTGYSFSEQSTISPMFDTVNSTFENITMAGPSESRLNSHNMTLSEWEVINSEGSPEKTIKPSQTNKSGTTMAPEFMTMETASDCTTLDGNSRSESPATTYSASWGMPELKIDKKYLPGIVLDTMDPSKFSIVPHHLWTELEKMHVEMRDFYTTYKTPVDVGFQVGDVCAVYHIEHEVWYRAVVQAILEEQIVVKFPDFSGNSEIVNAEVIRPLQQAFRVLPFFAVRCKLSGIEPLDGEKLWSNEAATKFNELVMNQTFQVEITSDFHVKDKPFEVRLHGKYAGKQVVINQMLVNLGLARKKVAR
ncbi:tudor domain-containing protein 7-like [Hydractinia symbiolongicarpus]|uniref:tudor domain-containing protein 7-like n=1 Tax=Hydractinia symbiolongicarpus TaxID=13093 RepID=UPI002550A102|nr:tudor domain-containing protein 7-like [Hydractinia symbiolongicarpus]